MIIYVNGNAAREGNGSKEMPFKHINDAAKVAKAGDEVVVAAGIYREYVDPVNGGKMCIRDRGEAALTETPWGKGRVLYFGGTFTRETVEKLCLLYTSRCV